LIIIVYCSKYAAARVLVPSNLECNSSKRWGLSAFSTYLVKSHGFLTATRLNPSVTWWANNVFIFKLEEEEKLALLLHLLRVFAETAVLCSVPGLGCRLVVASPQARADKTDDF
jgi:hypothetical protein